MNTKARRLLFLLLVFLISPIGSLAASDDLIPSKLIEDIRSWSTSPVVM